MCAALGKGLKLYIVKWVHDPNKNHSYQVRIVIYQFHVEMDSRLTLKGGEVMEGAL